MWGHAREHIEKKDADFILQEAIKQVEVGADYLDVNTGFFNEREAEYLSWLVGVIQKAVSTPLCIDTLDAGAAQAALRLHRGKAMLNSISAEDKRYNAVLPILKEHKCSVVVMLLDDSGMSDTVKDKMDITHRLIDKLCKEGIAEDDIYIDPLVKPISVEPMAVSVVLDTIARIKQECPGVHTIAAVSNVSYGLPARRQLNRAFTVLAIQAGLDAAIVDPCDRDLMASVFATEALLVKDEFCSQYLDAFRTGKLGTAR